MSEAITIAEALRTLEAIRDVFPRKLPEEARRDEVLFWIEKRLHDLHRNRPKFVEWLKATGGTW